MGFGIRIRFRLVYILIVEVLRRRRALEVCLIFQHLSSYVRFILGIRFGFRFNTISFHKRSIHQTSLVTASLEFLIFLVASPGSESAFFG